MYGSYFPNKNQLQPNNMRTFILGYMVPKEKDVLPHHNDIILKRMVYSVLYLMNIWTLVWQPIDAGQY